VPIIRATIAAGTGVTLTCAAFCQPAATPLKFDVASIKQAAPPPDGKWMVRMGGGPGRLDYSSVSLKAMIQRACEVQDYQIAGPDWMASARFDMVAKLPAGAPRSRIPEMLRALLEERFKLAIHRETREMPIYALVVGKNGPKMKEAEADPNAPAPDAARSAVRTSLDCGPRGETVVPAGWYMNRGPGRVEAHSVNMASLVNMLGALLGRPVMDQTGLKGNYDFEMEYAPEGQPVTPAGGPDVNGVSLFSAVQSQLGLKLDTKKGPVELIVVDHVKKIPAEN
jgi:uncharacterized protein (TIGR03435 family)